MLGHLNELTNKIDSNIESLMKIAELKPDWKLTDIDEKRKFFNICNGNWLAQIGRLGKNYLALTRKILEELYCEVDTTTNQILGSVYFNVVLVPNKTQISFSENQWFITLKNLLRRQNEWVEKSLPGLEALDKTYGGNEKKFIMLRDRSRILIAQVNESLIRLDAAYGQLENLHVLAASGGGSEEKEDRDGNNNKGQPSSSSASRLPSHGYTPI